MRLAQTLGRAWPPPVVARLHGEAVRYIARAHAEARSTQHLEFVGPRDDPFAIGCRIEDTDDEGRDNW